MSTATAPLSTVGISGVEALWLLEGSGLGRSGYPQRALTAVRPARHVWEYGRLVVRAPVRAAAVPGTVTYPVGGEEIRAVHGTGHAVTLHGAADVLGDADEAAHCRRTLPGWTHGPHDTLLHLHPQSVTGFRLARGES